MTSPSTTRQAAPSWLAPGQPLTPSTRMVSPQGSVGIVRVHPAPTRRGVHRSRRPILSGRRVVHDLRDCAEIRGEDGGRRLEHLVGVPQFLHLAAQPPQFGPFVAGQLVAAAIRRGGGGGRGGHERATASPDVLGVLGSAVRVPVVVRTVRVPVAVRAPCVPLRVRTGCTPIRGRAAGVLAGARTARVLAPVRKARAPVPARTACVPVLATKALLRTVLVPAGLLPTRLVPPVHVSPVHVPVHAVPALRVSVAAQSVPAPFLVPTRRPPVVVVPAARVPVQVPFPVRAAGQATRLPAAYLQCFADAVPAARPRLQVPAARGDIGERHLQRGFLQPPRGL